MRAGADHSQTRNYRGGNPVGKILVVDDDPEFVEITRMILESNGYEVSSASDGEQSLEAMRQDRPDLVVLDVMMSSVFDGLSVCREMRTESDLKDIPVIMVSSIITSPYASMFPTDEYLPIDTWISKPMDPDDLLKKVRKLLGAGSS
ncbi:MAG TPA: response regulator [Dehalococcoidia bacterium]|nr:response regulator [Dehalococcoidia bacterium]